MLSTLDQLDAALARMETYRLQVIAGLDGVGHAQEIGAHNTVQLLEFRYRLDPARARRDVRLALSLAKYEAVKAALPTTDQPITDTEVRMRPAQAEAIVSALEKVPTTVPVEDLDVAERELVGLARHLPPRELRQAGQRIRELLDTDGPEPEENKAYGRESLTLTPADRGVKFRGFLANENAELLRAVVHAGARPHKTVDGELDPRPREKRQADALTTALTIAATAWDTAAPGTAAAGSTEGEAVGDGSSQVRTMATAGSASTAAGSGGRVPGYGAKATITVTIDWQDLKAATADAIGDAVYGDGLSAAVVRRMACDARVVPLVLGSNSEPLDVGRSERFVTRAMRRALNARDRGCVVCGAPPIQCDAHHLVSWIDGGETKIANLALLCRRHHIDVHGGDWTITITDGIVRVSRPHWADPPHQIVKPHATPPPSSTVLASDPQPTVVSGGVSGAVSAGVSAGVSGSASGAAEEREVVATVAPVPSTAGFVARRSALGRRLLEEMMARGHQGVGAATSLREAACLAIWGESPTTADRRTDPEDKPLDTDAFDPWGEVAEVKARGVAK
ncbi:HNH endonuclease [Kribbella pratensis]|uniref:HNH endonuclease n=2 Tax=Kribbella pratensis TaxID=2512112 RepID=A0A4V3GFU5_9ACTN|nr:HNH endonuclease [Kribbella pratensis]